MGDDSLSTPASLNAKQLKIDRICKGEEVVAYRNKTYVIFDGDNDKWAYAFIKGWKSNENVDFNFHDAHSITALTANAQNEQYVKSALRERFASAKQVVCLIGENTKNLYRFVRWELETALSLGLPIIAVNLNKLRKMDPDRCPAIIRDTYTVHVSFNAVILQYALDNFPDEYHGRDKAAEGNRLYNESIYKSLGL